MTLDEAKRSINDLAAVRDMLKRQVEIVHRKKSWRDSEKAMTAANLGRQIDAVSDGIEAIAKLHIHSKAIT